MDTLTLLAAATGLAWASGFRLYLALFVVGLVARLGYLPLPEGLRPLEHELVLAGSALMTLVEFFVDKIPRFDSLWDAVHTFIRIPAAAVLAAGTLGSGGPALMFVAAVLGGAIASAAHLVKSGTRAFVNTSREPFSNWAASLTEDAMVLGGLWLAFMHPREFLLLLLLFLAVAIVLLPRLWRASSRIFTRLIRRPPPAAASPHASEYTPITAPNPAGERLSKE